MGRTARWVAAGTAALATSVLLAGCGSDSTDPPASSAMASTEQPQAARIDGEQCTRTPADGRIDRAGHGLEFRSGSMYAAITPTDGEDPACYRFTRWGNPNPAVPPDSLLFVFTGPGTDGAQIEFLVGDLTGGVLPPIGGVRPRVGPLERPINSTVGVSVGGVHHRSTACPLEISAMSSDGAAASFTCQAATRSDADPFAPDDDVAYDIDGDTAAPGEEVTISGWFELSP
ncbi:hypothetical protein VZC37_01920 [Gordonia sp. LSe1-13]|uniref:Lipoprotein n=1 Tax=Gordonia sesuvii TaxID=3116777 RepID=A0ABU7M7J1_9ACTN|nr:hypothetical protein [Gordonia sp. LSe1-13]